MTYIAGLLRDKRIAAVHSDSEVTYLMLSDGTQVTIRGLVVVEPAGAPPAELAAIQRAE